MPTSAVRCIAALTLGLCLAACSITPASSGDLDLRTGCSAVVAERRTVDAQVVMDVHATGCRELNDLLESHRLAHAVWTSLVLPVDAVRVSVSAGGSSPDNSPMTFTSEHLAERFGPGPSGIVWPAAETPDENIWVVLPMAYLAVGAAMLLLVSAMRRGGLFVVVVRR